MDKSAEEIVFTETGCNFCDQARKAIQEVEAEKHNLPSIIAAIKESGKGKKYDCLVGVSGGADSSTVLVKAVELGLRPLAFSVDNGWQDPKADENIMRLVEGLKVPFYRWAIDHHAFTRLQSEFIKKGQKNVEIPTDHILMATTYELASKYGIKYILSGGNVNTESIMPPSWGYNARDLVHMESVNGGKIKNLPTCSLLKWNYYRWIKRIEVVYLLDYLDYNRGESINMLEDKFGYIDYGEKHCESSFTMWFQNYYLFEKFNVDKRKAHLSSLIVSGQMSREEALEHLARNPVYPKLPMGDVMKYPKRPHTDFKTDNYELISKLVRCFS